MQESVFTRIQSLPLFQGISRDDLLRMIERARFNFVSVETGELITEQGKSASQLIYALSGTFQLTQSVSDAFRVTEILDAPFIFEPECLFGKLLTWRHTLQATVDAQLLNISKSEVVGHLMDFYTFRLSFLCYLSCHADHLHVETHFLNRQLSLSETMILFLSKYLISPTGSKTFYIGMNQLAQCLSTSRLSVSKCLNDLQREGLVHLGRKTIVIPQFELLLAKLEK